ncbi:hypothetical protein Golax_001865 [Gossypium laxum]|uniref:Uncharacterized protein n=1 Tax=Gossypium laxum TaxID=34288 RepID=A0A7J9ARF3_9ROSI|nr:hypothetical protein [Gossypium laxum]
MFSHEQEGKGNELMVANLFPMENFKEVQFRLQRSKNRFQGHLNGNVTRGTDYTAFQNPKRSQSPEPFAFMKIAYLGVSCASPTPIRLATVPCSCYLMLKAPRKVSNSIEISRQSMFYNMECSSSVLPEGRILDIF